jgi:hypothetical protein
MRDVASTPLEFQCTPKRTPFHSYLIYFVHCSFSYPISSEGIAINNWNTVTSLALNFIIRLNGKFLRFSNEKSIIFF